MKTKLKLKPDAHKSYKIGVDEIEGLKEAMLEAFKPVSDLIQEKVYWNDSLLSDAEYKSRDGFIPHSHNLGGIILGVIVPVCERYEFEFMEFGDCEYCGMNKCGESECASESEGHLDAYLRIWFKLESVSDDGEMSFYINASGGNGDAPYFRTQYLADIFEASFSCKSVAGLKRAASKHIQALKTKLA